MQVYNYYDVIISLEIINKLSSIIYLFFIKGSFLIYFASVMFCQFNVYLYLMAYNFLISSLTIVNLINIEFTFIQYFHILLKLFKVYTCVFIMYTIISNVKIFKSNQTLPALVFFLLVYLYLITGSFWSWLEPSWTSWWFGEDVEELIIFIIFIQFVLLIHYLNKGYYVKNLGLYSFFLLFLGYVGNLIIFTSRHKALSYYSVINLNFWLLFFLLSLNFIISKKRWYIFNISMVYNWRVYFSISKNAFSASHLYSYAFDLFFFYVFVVYEFPIFFKILSYYINLHFFISNIFNNDIIYILILNFFAVITKIKLFHLYLFLLFDWDVLLNSILFLNANLVWTFHFFFYYTYLIDATLDLKFVSNFEFFIFEVNSPKLIFTNYPTLELNINWIFGDNILNLDFLQVIAIRDLIYFILVLVLVFFFSWKLI